MAIVDISVCTNGVAGSFRGWIAVAACCAIIAGCAHAEENVPRDEAPAMTPLPAGPVKPPRKGSPDAMPEGGGPAPISRDEAFPHTLRRDEIVAHFERYPEVEARVGERPPFKLKVLADGKVERTCSGCKPERGNGTMTLKPGEPIVCFQWTNVGYPHGGCFRIVQITPEQFELRGTNGEPAIQYTVPL
jgi:hypothetical protein